MSGQDEPTGEDWAALADAAEYLLPVAFQARHSSWGDRPHAFLVMLRDTARLELAKLGDQVM